jgi:hypothetical protein
MQQIFERIQELEQLKWRWENTLADSGSHSEAKIRRELRAVEEMLAFNKELLLKLGNKAAVYH